MTDQHAVPNDPIRNLEPVHADEPEAQEARWTGRLVLFLRLMAVLSLAKGLYHWAVVCGFTGFAVVRPSERALGARRCRSSSSPRPGCIATRSPTAWTRVQGSACWTARRASRS